MKIAICQDLNNLYKMPENLPNVQMKSKKIVVIDDKDYAIKQVKYNFPRTKIEKYDLYYFEAFYEFEKSKIDDIFIIFLDFFLDKDRKVGTEFIPKLQSEYFVGFSSLQETTNTLAQVARESKQWESGKVFGIQKLASSIENMELKILFERILL